MAATATVDIEVRGLDEARDGVSAFKGAVDIMRIVTGKQIVL